MPSPLIHADKVSVKFVPLKRSEKSLMSNPLMLISDLYLRRSRREAINILEDITFDLRSGDRLGIIGVNGAGKSTLIRLLAGIYHPSQGRLDIQGKATGLFNVSMGMNPGATGLENIYLRGLQIGMTLGEIKEKIPDILEFTQLGDDIHHIFDTYSSGMRLRLAFAISTMIEPDILLMDEWLGAGDARFTARVKDRLNHLVEKSRALVLTSHNTVLLKGICNKGLVLDKGQQIYFGDLEKAIRIYNEDIVPKTSDAKKIV